MNPLAALVLVVLCVVILTAPRRWALLALLTGALYVTQYEAISLLGLNLFSARLLELMLLARVLTRREWSFFNLNAIDRAVLLLYVYATVVFLLRSKDGQAYQVGGAVDAFLVYFSCRALIGSPEDFRWLLRSFVLLLIPFVLAVAIERLKGHSPLAFVGWGSQEGTWMRDGKVRCFGSFRNPTLLGTIGVSFIPIFVGMAFRPEDRNRAALGIALCLTIVWAANSGGPVSGVAFGAFAWLFWKVRTKMRAVRWGIVAFISLAAILMKAPVWYLVAHVSEITGGDGWHRAFLMDVSFQNLGKWWLAGMPITDTISWFPYSLAATNGADITNQFVGFGITAGVGALALFILLLARAFSALGKALHAVRTASMQPDEDEFLLWGLGAMLAAHIINWLGITYFDQIYVFWFVQLAAISTLSDWYLKKTSEAGPETQEEETGSELQKQPVTAQ
jgi:hypothetical protein